MRTYKRGYVLAVGIGLSLIAVLAGCGSSSSGVHLNKVGLERAIAESILTEHHIYTLVSCPTEPQQEGLKFTCEAMLTVGRYPIEVTETNGKGHVSYANTTPLVVLDSASVTRAIKRTLLTERGLHAHVSCPSNVLQQKGVIFTCTAVVRGKSYPFEVTEVDSRGAVHYIGR
jgi:hypothetical protein